MFKKSKRKEKTEAKASNKSLTRVVVAIIAAVLVAFGITGLQSYLLTDKAVAEVVVASQDIPQGTLISEKNVTTYFETKEVNASLVTDATVTGSEISQLYGKALTDISEGEIMTLNRIFNTAWVNESYTNPVEVSFTVSGAEAAVNGVLRAGDLVDILTLTTDEDGNTTTSVLLPNVYLLRVYNSSFVQIASTDSSSLALGFTIYVEAAQEEYINAKLAMSSVYLVKLDTKNLDRENSGTAYYEDENGTVYMQDAGGNMFVTAEDGFMVPYEMTGDERFTEIAAPETTIEADPEPDTGSTDVTEVVVPEQVDDTATEETSSVITEGGAYTVNEDGEIVESDTGEAVPDDVDGQGNIE
jgi:hypothetical protein